MAVKWHRGAIIGTDTELIVRAMEMVVADREQLRLFAAAVLGTSRVMRWVSADLRREARALRAESAHLRSRSAMLRLRGADCRPLMSSEFQCC